MSALNEVTGMVLAGGRGSRMGGVDKGMQLFRGSSLALNALQRLQMQQGKSDMGLAALMINANRNLDDYKTFGAPVWPDTLADYAGPLAGFLTGLAHCQTPYLLTVPCDCPLLPLDLAQRLLTALKAEQASIAIAQAPENGKLRAQPVFALLHYSVLTSLQHFTQNGGRKIESWTNEHKTAYVPFNLPHDDRLAFANANTLEELRALEQSQSDH